MGRPRAPRKFLISVGQNYGMSTAAATLTPRVVPANTSALYYLRTPDVVSRQQLEIRVRACSEAEAFAIGCAHEVTRVSPVYIDFVRVIGEVSRRCMIPVITARGAV
jgi:metal-dependent amidase/aminoacylase/carboxypeptidase family protein